MKPQDVVFLIMLLALIFKRKPNCAVGAGMISLFLSIPLFSFWIFFTAQHLVWYAAAFFLVAIILQLMARNSRIKE